jgi:DNA-binding response OmpR family regulator
LAQVNVLVIEEEPSIARIIAFKLSREGYEVTTSETPCAVARTDLIVAECCAAEQIAQENPGVPLLVLYEPRREKPAVGCPVAKPFKPTVLARRVREMLAEAGKSHLTC